MRARHWLGLLLLVPLGIGLGRVRLDTDILNLLPAELPIVRGLKLHRQHFARVRELILTVRADEAETAAIAMRAVAETLRLQTGLVSQVIWQPPFVEHPEHTPELLAFLWLNQPPEQFAALTSRLAPTQLSATLQAARTDLAASMSPTVLGSLGYDPFGLTQLPAAGGRAAASFRSHDEEGFGSRTGTFRVAFVEPAMDISDYRVGVHWLRQIQELVERCRQAQGWGRDVAVRYTGEPVFVAEAAAGMERDMKSSVASTLVLIALLFGWAHRRLWPLAYLVLSLGLTVLGTLAVGGLLLGELNVVSFGFAAILLGLAVDYGLLLYQEARAAPQPSAAALRRAVGPSIGWAALTTAGAFLMLHFGGLPGLSQLGTLVGVGVFLAAAVMLFLFLPLVLRSIQPSQTIPVAAGAGAHGADRAPNRVGVAVTTLAIVAAVLVVLTRTRPSLDHTTKPLEPEHSAAQPALAELEIELGQSTETAWFLLAGRDEAAVAGQLEVAERTLARAVSNRVLRSYALPLALWPRPEWQRSNRGPALNLARRREELHRAGLAAGFTTNALSLADSVFQTWERAANTGGVFWPTNASCRWLLEQVSARADAGWLALGVVHRAGSAAVPRRDRAPFAEVPGALWASMPMLGESLLRHVEPRVLGLSAAMLCLLTACLWLAFRRWREIGLSLATLGLSFLLLLAIMGLAGWKWNLMNLTALPLLLGCGVDYSIHVQLALRRHAGDWALVRRVTGKAVFLCAASTVIGFGSLGWSSNAGLASLGAVCATGVACALVVSLTLLPAWWQSWVGAEATLGAAAAALAQDRSQSPARSDASVPGSISRPSAFYRVGIWRLGLAVARTVPQRWLERGCAVVARLYWISRPRRRAVVIENLLPLCSDHLPLAKTTARSLFDHFGRKLADLWRWESGALTEPQLAGREGWEHFETARASGRGILLVTPHLGNWELGGAILGQRGVKLLVLTLEEPDPRLTELRRASRLARGIETLVVGQDAFAFVEIIQRLQAGATVALLIDRPPQPGAVTVELCGRPFQASVAAAELARASGCVVLGVCVLRMERGYTPIILPEFQYDRAALGRREARVQFTQEILRAFEPLLRQHRDQWYHFVPIWPAPAAALASAPPSSRSERPPPPERSTPTP